MTTSVGSVPARLGGPEAVPPSRRPGQRCNRPRRSARASWSSGCPEQRERWPPEPWSPGRGPRRVEEVVLTEHRNCSSTVTPIASTSWLTLTKTFRVLAQGGEAVGTERREHGELGHPRNLARRLRQAVRRVRRLVRQRSALKKAVSTSLPTSGDVSRSPIASTLASFHRRAPRAVSASVHSAPARRGPCWPPSTRRCLSSSTPRRSRPGPRPPPPPRPVPCGATEPLTDEHDLRPCPQSALTASVRAVRLLVPKATRTVRRLTPKAVLRPRPRRPPLRSPATQAALRSPATQAVLADARP